MLDIELVVIMWLPAAGNQHAENVCYGSLEQKQYDQTLFVIHRNIVVGALRILGGQAPQGASPKCQHGCVAL